LVSPRRQVLADLANHPGWKELSEVVLETKNQYFANLASMLYNKPETVDEVALIRKSEFFKGMIWLLANPAFELRQLQAELDKEGDSA
jgi:hypothetical protein